LGTYITASLPALRPAGRVFPGELFGIIVGLDVAELAGIRGFQRPEQRRQRLFVLLLGLRSMLGAQPR
jgi:hypothetical protein